jgi:hypothetical protein
MDGGNNETVIHQPGSCGVVAFPFKDPEWQQKALVGSLIVLLGFVIPLLPSIFLMGYLAQILKGIIRTNRKPFLPKWDDWGKFFNDGWKLFGASFIYSLPLYVILILIIGSFITPMLAMPFLAGQGENGQTMPLLLISLGSIGE